MRSLWTFALGVWLAGCGGEDQNGRLKDAPIPIDAAPDAAPPDAAPPFPAREVTTGAHHLRGARFAADVQIGHPFDQRPVAGNRIRLEGNAAVKP